MTRKYFRTTKSLAFLLALTLSGVPRPLLAQSAPAERAIAQPAPQNDNRNPAQSSGQGTVNPAQGPLEPVTPSGTVSQTEVSVPNASSASRRRDEPPTGVAVGQSGATAGGPASRPAGVAIAPAKQRQTRSLLIKVGAIAAAGLAVGTVYALSRGTPSTPPGAK